MIERSAHGTIWVGLLQSSLWSCCSASLSLGVNTISSMRTEGGAGAVATAIACCCSSHPFHRCFLHWPVHTSLPPYEQLLIVAVAGSALCLIRSPSVNTLIWEGVVQSSLSWSSISIVLIVVLASSGGCWSVLDCFPRWWLVMDIGRR